MLSQLKIFRFDFQDKKLAAKAFDIRRKVFVEEQGVDPVLEYDKEEPSHHYLMLLGEKAIGAARWRETPEGIKLERFAVLKEYRNRGLGKIILKEVLSDVIPTGKKIYLHSQQMAMPFYERNGFVKKGEEFVEAGMKHYYMEFRG